MPQNAAAGWLDDDQFYALVAKLKVQSNATKAQFFRSLLSIFCKKLGPQGEGIFAELTSPICRMMQESDREVDRFYRVILGRGGRRVLNAGAAEWEQMKATPALQRMIYVLEALFTPKKLSMFNVIFMDCLHKHSLDSALKVFFSGDISQLDIPQLNVNTNQKSMKLEESVASIMTEPTVKLALEQATPAELFSALLDRGSEVKKTMVDLAGESAKVRSAISDFDANASGATKALEEIVASAQKNFTDLSAQASDKVKTIAEATKGFCETVAKESEARSTERSFELETECLQRVEAVEAQFKASVETITKEFQQRAESAEQEALLCIDRADQATASADALGKSFNMLNERVHELEVMMRTFFRSGMSPAPVYSPQGAVALMPQPAPPPVDLAPSASAVMNGKHRDDDDGHKMTFVLLGLHQKDVAHIVQRLRKPTARHVELIVVENTSKESLPKHVDYAIVSGDHDLNRRWNFCLETYGPSKCVRLINGSVVSFRQKIEELYEAKHPINAPAQLTSVGQALNVAVQRA